MDRKLYNEIFDLIDDTARHYREKEQEYLDQLDATDTTVNGFYIDRLAKAHSKAKEYEALLKRFEQEVDYDEQDH